MSGKNKFKEQYYDPAHEAGFAGARNLLRVSAQGRYLSNQDREKLLAWLDDQDTYTLHRPVRRRFQRLRYNFTNIDDVWKIDLMQLTSMKQHNDGFSYLLVVVDVLSKNAWVEAMRDKTMATATKAFEKMLNRADGWTPFCLLADKGSEFIGSVFQKFLNPAIFVLDSRVTLISKMLVLKG